MKKIKSIILLLLPIFIILIIVYICALNYIKVEYRKSNKSIGIYDKVEILEEEVADKYLNRILDMIESKDYEAIVSNIDRDNPEYAALGTYGIQEKLEALGIIGKKLEKKEYSTNYVENLNNIFNYSLLDNETGKIYNLVIREYSPNIYTFSFVE